MLFDRTSRGHLGLSVTQIVTFYSFKGGVGRTMTLVNTAYALAKLGARVLMVDFDLEAPGMTHFFSATVHRRGRRATRDALDLLLEAKHSFLHPMDDAAKPSVPLSLKDYIFHLEPSAPTAKSFSPYFAGRVDLLPASLESSGRGNNESDALISLDYLDRIAALDLPGLFGPQGPGHLFGKYVAEYFRNARFEAPGDLIFSLRTPVHASYDFVLVDSRTGLNEISGLCIGPLCDKVVICTGLNEQNLAGTRYFLERTGLLDKEKGKPYLVVAGPVPPWRSEESQVRLETIRRDLAAQQVIEVPYHPAAALAERLFVLDEPPEQIAGAFSALAEAIMSSHVLSIIPKITQGLREINESNALLEDWGVIAALPNACRLMRSPELAEQFAPPFFPTPLESVLLSQIGARRAESLVMAVAVALSRRLSARLTERVITLLDFLNFRSDARQRILICIVFFYTRLHGRKGRQLISNHLSAEDNRVLAEVTSKKRGRFGLPGLALRHISGANCNHIDFEREVRHYAFNLYRFADELGSLSLDLSDEQVLWSLWKANYCNVEIDRTTRIDKLVSSVTEALGERESSMEIRDRPLEALYGRSIEPPGFSPVLTVGSVIAEIKGPAAVNIVLKCIEKGRRNHGYAWRVMINWNRLKRVRSCPEFQDFLAAEDNAVKHVEAQFDQGIWPL
jgi:MinD-like ATPase involved in chromosome partitioning or flagellar assembly